MKSAYIHIPFCNSICSYCDFCKVFYNETLVDKYLDNLEQEIKKEYKGEVLKTIYIGGGTPSSLNINQLNRLFDIIDIFNKDDNIEFTIECNFNSVDYTKLDLFRKRGINRISLGIETINKKYYDFLNRYEDINRIKDIINYSKSIGLININVDLMYAFKDETIDDVKNDLDFIKQLDVKHVSIYSLIIENNTMLGINNVSNISEDIDFSMYEFICNYLNNENFIHYEISNFAKDGYCSKHNLCYWNNSTYYGFGLGASSYMNYTRKSNTRSMKHYFEHKYIYSEELLTEDDLITYQIILNLRLNTGINKKTFFKRYGKNIDELYDYSFLIKNKLLIDNNFSLFIPEDKWYISNEIIVKFLEGVKNG